MIRGGYGVESGQCGQTGGLVSPVAVASWPYKQVTPHCDCDCVVILASPLQLSNTQQLQTSPLSAGGLDQIRSVKLSINVEQSG